MKRTFSVLSRSAIMASALICAGGAAQARDFTYAGWGGGLQDTQRKVYLEPFKQRTGKPYKEDVYLGGWASFETMKSSGNITWDVVNVEAAELQRGCDEGAFVSLDFERIGKEKDAFVPGGATECGIGSYAWSFALAYNSDTLSNAPTKMTDIWDTKTWPGKRGMRKGPRFNLELALMADGVPARDVYKTLSTAAGLDRAFAKLDEIKNDVLWWEAPAQAVDQLVSGNVVMNIAPNARISDAAKSGKPFKLAFTPGMVGIDYWVILEGAPALDDAYEFLKIAVDTDRQAEFSKEFAYGPTVREAAEKLPEDVRVSLPVGEAVNGALDISSPESNTFWADNGDKLGERWNVWLVK